MKLTLQGGEWLFWWDALSYVPGKPHSSILIGYQCFMGILATPPKATPPRNKGLIRPY